MTSTRYGRPKILRIYIDLDHNGYVGAFMIRFNSNSLQSFVDRLASHSVLTELEEQAILALPIHPVHLKTHRDLVHEDVESAHGYVVTSGMLGRFGQTAHGLRQVTAVFLPGDMADLQAVVRPSGLGGLTALCNTAVLRIPHADIRAIAARYPGVAEAFWRDCMLDATILTHWTVNVGRRSAQTRIAHLLCEMAVRLGKNREASMRYDFPLTQDLLGDSTALTGVHVNRSLRSLSNEGLVTFTKGVVEIHDWDRLVHTAEFDAAYLVADLGPKRQPRLAGDCGISHLFDVALATPANSGARPSAS